MKIIEKLYEEMLKTNVDEFYLVESKFCGFLDNMNQCDEKEKCIVAFLTVANWFASSQRSGVWTFYETAHQKDLEDTLEYLKLNGNEELYFVFKKGIHDYQNKKYELNYDYPEEWLSESEEIDEWIAEHEEFLWSWDRELLINNKELILTKYYEE